MAAFKTIMILLIGIGSLEAFDRLDSFEKKEDRLPPEVFAKLLMYIQEKDEDKFSRRNIANEETEIEDEYAIRKRNEHGFHELREFCERLTYDDVIFDQMKELKRKMSHYSEGFCDACKNITMIFGGEEHVSCISNYPHLIKCIKVHKEGQKHCEAQLKILVSDQEYHYNDKFCKG